MLMGRRRTKNLDLPPRMRRIGQAFYYDHGGTPRRYQPLGSDKPKALMKWAEIEAGGQAGDTVAHLVDRYMAALPTLADNTVKNYRRLAYLVKQRFGSCPLSDVSRGHVQEFIDRYPSKAMGRNIVVFYKQVLNKAVAWEVIPNNPLDKMKLKGQAKRRRYITDAEFIAIRDKLKGPYRVSLELAYWLGLRVSGVVRLRWSHFKDGVLQFHPPKSREPLSVTVTPAIEEILARAKALPGNVRAFTVICTRYGTPFKEKTVSRAFKNAADAAGVLDVRFHDLRRKSASDDPGTAQKRLGHMDEQTTRIYTVKPEVVMPLDRKL